MIELTTKEKIYNFFYTVLIILIQILSSPLALLMYVSVLIYLPFSNATIYLESKIKRKRTI